MANENLGVATEPSPESLQLRGFTFVQWGLTFWNLSKHRCFVMLDISVGGGAWSLVSEGISPPKPAVWTVWQNFSLLFNAIASEKYLGYAICQACKVCQTFCL